MPRNGHQLTIGSLFWQREEDQRKGFKCCLNPNSSTHILYFRAIQGHCGGIAVDPELQDNVLLPKGFAEYIHHVGNASEMNSTIRSGLIPGGRSLERGRQSVFFTFTNPMEDENCVEETPCDLTQPRIVLYKYLENLIKIQFVVQFETRSRERIAVFPNKVACNRLLRHTTSCLHREGGMHEGEG